MYSAFVVEFSFFFLKDILISNKFPLRKINFLFEMIKILYQVIKDINILKPTQAVKSVNGIDFVSLKEKGIRYVVFDKDQTVTLQDTFEYYNEQIVESMKKAQNTMGEDNIAFLSNSSKRVKFT